MQLYFLRHGLAEKRTDWSGDDADRPLTSEGRERMAREAAGMARLGLAPDLILTSPLPRSRETAQIVAEHLQLTDRLRDEDRLRPGFSAAKLAKLLADHPDAEAIMLVGHDPDFSETVGRLAGGANVALKKGALAYVELKDRSAKKGQLHWLLPPQALEG